MAKLNVERKKITDLTPDPSNANAGTERGLSMLDDSLSVVGLGRSIVTDKHGVIIGGNKTTERALDRGFENAIVVHTTGDELVVVQRDDLDLADSDPNNAARKLAYYDNRVASVDLQWNADQLLADVNAGFDFEHLFSDDELAALLAGLDTGSGDDPGAQVDRAAELQQKWQTERGQLWLIGKHRLLCGDSTNAEDVARLMDGERADMVFTDPPYGVEYEGGTIKRDALDGDKSPDLYAPALKLVAAHSDEKVAVYLWHSDSKSAAVSAAVSAAGFERRCTIIWNKNQAQFGALGAQYKTKHEPCYYLYKRGKSPNWYGATNEVTVWDVDREQVNDLHPTQKPPELARRAMKNSSLSGDVVYDPFGGSGTTMVACEQLSRQCRMLEIEPKYCAVILERLSGMGISPELQGVS